MKEPITCPKCNDQRMEPLSLSVTPLTIKTGIGSINVGIPPVGLPIHAYECPKCGIIEFYHKRDS